MSAASKPTNAINRLSFIKNSTFGVEKSPTDELGRENCIFITSGSLPNDAKQMTTLMCMIQSKANTVYLTVKEHPSVTQGKVALNNSQRKLLQLSFTDTATLQLCESSRSIPTIQKLVLEVGLLRTTKEKAVYEAKKVAAAFKVRYAGQILNLGLTLSVMFDDRTLMFTPKSLNEDPSITVASLLGEDVEINLEVHPDHSNLQLKGNAKAGAIQALNLDFNSLGVGGLDAQFRDIITRAFYSRNLPEELVNMYGLEHVKGILLYGPPGTGKTLIARTIANMFPNTKVKVVNGPEVLDKFVGKSEENIRKLFEEAEKDWNEKGASSPLHVIIFDEIDSICKQRGSSSGGTGVGDSVVNQLLTKLDGVESAKNVLVIGMTNRKDLIDEALLRQGRLSVHIQIGLADESGRRSILDIHTKNLRENNLLAPDVDLNEWARRTVNFSGADLKGLISEATYSANSRNFDTKEGTKPVLKDLKKNKPEPVTHADLEVAFGKVTPSFGIAVNKLEPYLKRNFTPFNEVIRQVQQSIGMDFLTLQLTQDNPTRSILLTGEKGVGKTALAVHLAVMSQAPLITLLTSGDLAGLSEIDKMQKLEGEFKKAQQSKYSVLVLDNVEGILGATRDGRTYSAQMALKLESLLSDPAYNNLLVIGTSSYTPFLNSVGLLSSFREHELAKVSSFEEVVEILKGLGLDTNECDIPTSELLPIAIKDLLEKIQTFKALRKDMPWNTSVFLNALCQWNPQGLSRLSLAEV